MPFIWCRANCKRIKWIGERTNNFALQDKSHADNNKKREVTAPKYKLYCITKKQFRPKTISWTFSLTTFQHIFNKSAKMNKANTNQFWAKANRFAFSVPLCRGFYFIFQFHHCVWLCWSRFTSNFPFLLFFYFGPSQLLKSHGIDYGKSAFKRRAYPPSACTDTIQINVYYSLKVSITYTYICICRKKISNHFNPLVVLVALHIKIHPLRMRTSSSMNKTFNDFTAISNMFGFVSISI